MTLLRLELNGRSVDIRLEPRTLVGSDPVLGTWVVRTVDGWSSLPPMWLDLRWSSVDAVWVESATEIDVPGPWISKGMVARLVDDGPPEAFAWCRDTQSWLTGDAFIRLLRKLDWGEKTSVAVADGRTYRVCVPEGFENDRLSIRIRLAEHHPELKVFRGEHHLSLRGRLVWSVLPYARERLESPGWLTAVMARRYYADELGINEDSVRLNRMSEDRLQIDRKLRSEGVLEANASLFERHLAGRHSAVRLMVRPQNIHIVADGEETS